MRRLPFLAFALLLAGCPANRVAQKTMHGSAANVPPAMIAHAPAAIATITKLRGPESVLYDPEQDVYLISNINGQMLSVDDNGFLSRVDAKTLAIDPWWVSAGKNGVTLDAPKGMAILGDTLYVTDIDTVRKFDRRTGMPRGNIDLPGSSFLNDITTDGNSLYVSDTGIRTGPGNTFFDTGTDAIWKITSDRAEKLADSHDLLHPNGLDWVDGTLRVVTFRGNELYDLAGGKKSNVRKLPYGQLDGLIHLPDGTPIVSSWKGDGIYRADGHTFRPILTSMDAPADLGYDPKRHRLLVPQPTANQVTIHDVR
jgi:DNA-binding beta-propeller fold protein YncE